MTPGPATWMGAASCESAVSPDEGEFVPVPRHANESGAARATPPYVLPRARRISISRETGLTRGRLRHGYHWTAKAFVTLKVAGEGHANTGGLR